MQSTRGAAILAAVAVLTGGLTACGDDSEPQESTTTASPIDRSTDSPSSSESSSSSGSETSSGDGSGDDAELPDDLPAEARKNTKEGAAAFGEYYYDAMADADHTGDTSDLRLLALDTCSPCKQAVTDIEADAKKGQTRSENPNTLTKVQASERPDSGYKVSMNVDVKPHHVYENGEIVSDVEATNYTLTQHVTWQDGKWQISDWVIS